MNLAPILPYITWGFIQDPQNKRGIPDLIEKAINTNYSRSKQKEEDILTTIHINIKLRKARRIRRLYYHKRWLIEMVQL